jgi:hypothetical protein
MFTLGNKEAIVNSPTQFPFVPTAATPGAVLNIQGFGTFDPTKIVSAVACRATDAQLAKLAFTCPTSAELGIAATDVGVAVIVHLRVNSLRHSSEWAIDFIKRGRPMILELRVDGGSSAATVAGLVKAALDEYALKFNNITLPITYAVNGNDIEVTATAGYYQISESVTFLKRGDIFAYTAATSKKFDSTLTVNDASPTGNPLVLSALTGLKLNETLYFQSSPTVGYKITDFTSTGVVLDPVIAAGVTNGDTITKENNGAEAINDGKYLEETVRMSTQYTEGPYSINPNQVPIIGAKYTMISWTIAPSTADLTWQVHKSTDPLSTGMATQTYTLYFNEATCLASGGPVDKLLLWLDNSANVALTDFKKANGGSALVNVADFIA